MVLGGQPQSCLRRELYGCTCWVSGSASVWLAWGKVRGKVALDWVLSLRTETPARPRIFVAVHALHGLEGVCHGVFRL
jgi:hypothetical protein